MKNIKTEIKWALIFVMMMLAWMYIEKLTGLYDEHIDKHMIYTNFIAIPAILIYVLALRDKRTNYYNGKMTYKQGVLSGLIITLIVTVFSPLVQYITSTIIAPEYFPNIIEYATNKGLATREEAESYFNLKSYMIQSVIGAPVMGILTTLIVAAFLRRK